MSKNRHYIDSEVKARATERLNDEVEQEMAHPDPSVGVFEQYVGIYASGIDLTQAPNDDETTK